MVGGGNRGNGRGVKKRAVNRRSIFTFSLPDVTRNSASPPAFPKSRINCKILKRVHIESDLGHLRKKSILGGVEFFVLSKGTSLRLGRSRRGGGGKGKDVGASMSSPAVVATKHIREERLSIFDVLDGPIRNSKEPAG